MIDQIAGVILAGGLARRMGGGDKGQLEIGGKPILRHVIDRLTPQTQALIINANGEPSRFAAYGLPVVADSIPGAAGPLAGVLAGLDWASLHSFAAIVTAATDTPFLPRDLVARLVEAARMSHCDLAVAASAGQRHPVIGLWPSRLRDDLRQALTSGVRKVDEWTGQHRIAVAEFEADPVDPFFNANKPKDLMEAEALLSRLNA
jgi:molybdopterin-guanine dinucleotide biosynthesis protein A